MIVVRSGGARLRRVASDARRRAREAAVRRGLESRLVWVLGSPRSGSTWLLQLLAEHDRVVPVNEPLIGWYLGPFLSDLPGWDSDTLTVEDFTLRRVQRAKDDQFFADAYERVWLPALREMMLRRFAAQAVRRPPRAGRPDRALVVLKEPNGSQSADVLMAALPRSRLLFLLRDGRDVVDSELAANLKGSWVSREFAGGGGIMSEAERLAFVKQSARKWLWRTEVTERAFAAHPGPRRLVRYEDLRERPDVHLAQLLAWLGIPLADGSPAEIAGRHAFERVPEDQRGPDKFFRAASPGLWRRNLTPAEQEALDGIIGPKLRELGYDAPGASS